MVLASNKKFHNFQLRQVALQYYNCPGSNEIWIREMSREYMTQQRIKSQQEHKTFLEHCRHLIKADRASLRCAQSSVSVTFANIVNSSNDPGQRIFGPMNMNEHGGISHRYSNVDTCNAITANRLTSGNAIDQRSSETLAKRELQRKCETFVDEENVKFFVDTESEVCRVDDVSGHSVSQELILFLRRTLTR